MEGLEIKAVKDNFHGLIIKSTEQDLKDEDKFIQILKDSMLKWQTKDQIRGVWFKVQKEHTTLVPHLIQIGFEFHHAKPGYVMLTHWLSDEPNGLPEYANQYIGVGGFVVNDKNELLVIKEKYALRTVWKLPGGHADAGEELADTAIREVFEETGIKTEFQSLLCFRHQHQYRFGCSDIYFVCLLKPIGGEIKPCQQEIAECTWMNLEDYVKLPDITATLRQITDCYLQLSQNGQTSIIPQRIANYNNTTTNNIYTVSQIDKL